VGGLSRRGLGDCDSDLLLLYSAQGKRANFWVLSLNACKHGSVHDEIWFILSTTVFKFMAEFMGCNIDHFRFYGMAS
jgi:hypothetical protein